jgi:hypothetical protein
MPIDTSIYGNLKQIAMPSVLDSRTKAANLSSLVTQQERAGKQMAREDEDAKMTAHLRKASMFGNALEGISGLSEQERAAAYPKIKQELVASGVMGPQDLPDEYDPGLYRQNLMRYRSSREGIESRLAQTDLALKQSQIAKNYADAKNGPNGVNALAKRLPADKVLLVNEGNELPKLLENIGATLEANADSFGPVMGRLSSLNPYDERGQAIQSQMKTAAQQIGKYMEGGVLRKEDEAKYQAMLPALSDTPETAKNKLAIVRNMLASKQKSDVAALAASGYDATGVARGDLSVPDLPDALTRGKGKGGAILGAEKAMASDSGRVKVSNGKETYFIELRDLPDAMKDGFKAVK